jgi:TrmH family RNA methyltransferase
MITSRKNERIKDALGLYKRAERDRCGLTLVEGYRQVLAALEAGVRIETLFFCREVWLGENEDALVQRAAAAGARLEETSAHVFERLSIRERPDGLIAVVAPARRSLADLDSLVAGRPGCLLLAVEGIEKPGNLGAILRSADGAGVDAVLVCDRVTDVHNPNVVRASLGTLFFVPVIETTSAAAREWLAARSIQTLAASPAAALAFTDADLTSATAIVVGSEQYGLDRDWLEGEGAVPVSIPMRGRADSLNVAQAATLLVYEALRQRATGS